MTAATLIPRKFSRAGLVVVALGVVFAGIGVYLHQAEQREQALIKAIYESGGKVLRPSFNERWNAFVDGKPLPGTHVFLPYSDVDDAWLLEHDYLRGLMIDSLTTGDRPLSADSLAKVLTHHPVRALSAIGDELNDDVITALATNCRLNALFAGSTNLTDADLARLPLEQLKGLDVSETDVTPHGMAELQRCNSLWNLDLDGKQFTRESAQSLAELPALTHLSLSGSNVTDEHLALIPMLPHLKQLQVWDAAITESGKQSLKQSRPYVEFIW